MPWLTSEVLFQSFCSVGVQLSLPNIFLIPGTQALLRAILCAPVWKLPMHQSKYPGGERETILFLDLDLLPLRVPLLFTQSRLEGNRRNISYPSPVSWKIAPTLCGVLIENLSTFQHKPGPDPPVLTSGVLRIKVCMSLPCLAPKNLV